MRFSAGDPLRAEVEFVVHDPVRDAVIEIYFYSNWGNLHGSFSTESSGERIDLEPGSGTVEFSCPGIALEVASYNVEASIKHRGSQFSEHIDYKHGAVINLGPGKPVKWRRKGSNEASHDREVEVIVKDTF